MKALILDTETTGLDIPHATEIAFIGVTMTNNNLEKTGQEFNQRYNPQKTITFGSMATTGICEEDIVHCPDHTDFRLPTVTEYIIGHNIDYDCDVLINAGCDMSNIKRICTLAIARKIYPNLDSHKLTALLYCFKYNLAREQANKKSRSTTE